MYFKKDSLSNDISEKDMVLIHSKNKSFFFSYDKFKYDSIAKKNERNQLPSSNSFDYEFMLIKNFSNNNLERYTKLLNRLYMLEFTPVFNWQITQEKKVISGYNSQKAILKYKGRLWEAWFTNDIPIFDGPYSFYNLPGLILELKDSKENYIFVCNGLKETQNLLDFSFNLTPFPINEEQLKKILLDHYNDPYREAKSGNSKTRWFDENGNEFTPDYRELTKNEQETIKKYNNPIELSEAIHYK